MSRSFLVRSFIVVVLVSFSGLVGLAWLPHLISVDISASPDAQTCSAPYIAVRNTGLFPVDLNRWKLEYQDGTFSYAAPNYRLSRGQTVRIWSGIGQNDASNLYAGRSDAVWSLNGLVVHGKLLGVQERYWTNHCRPGE